MVNPLVCFPFYCFFLLFVRVTPRINRAVISLAPERGTSAAREGEPGLIRESLVLEFQHPPVAEVNPGGWLLACIHGVSSRLNSAG